MNITYFNNGVTAYETGWTLKDNPHRGVNAGYRGGNIGSGSAAQQWEDGYRHAMASPTSQAKRKAVKAEARKLDREG